MTSMASRPLPNLSSVMQPGTRCQRLQKTLPGRCATGSHHGRGHNTPWASCGLMLIRTQMWFSTSDHLPRTWTRSMRNRPLDRALRAAMMRVGPA